MFCCHTLHKPGQEECECCSRVANDGAERGLAEGIFSRLLRVEPAPCIDKAEKADAAARPHQVARGLPGDEAARGAAQQKNGSRRDVGADLLRCGTGERIKAAIGSSQLLPDGIVDDREAKPRTKCRAEPRDVWHVSLQRGKEEDKWLCLII